MKLIQIFTSFAKGPVLIASNQGGVNIEDVAAEHPEAILYEPIDIAKGLTKEQAVKIAEKVGLGNVSDTIAQTLLNMYQLFIKKDALLIEINPLAEDAFDNSKCKLHQYQTSKLINFLSYFTHYYFLNSLCIGCQVTFR